MTLFTMMIYSPGLAITSGPCRTLTARVQLSYTKTLKKARRLHIDAPKRVPQSGNVIEMYPL